MTPRLFFIERFLQILQIETFLKMRLRCINLGGDYL